MKNKMKRTIAFAATIMMAVSLIPASPVLAKTKYKKVKDDGKEYIVFGKYEQDGNTKNGKEPIEWEVLGEDKNGIFVISRYVLDCQPYNKECKAVTWKACSLRKWLNKDFYESAFNKKEKAKIKTTNVKTPDNKYFGNDGGGNTKDKLFCLSVDEVLDHYTFDIFYEESNPDMYGDYNHGYSQALIIPATEYAKSKDLYAYEITEFDYDYWLFKYNFTKDCIGCEGSPWWNRTPGMYDEDACFTMNTGHAGFCQNMSSVNELQGVRPAMYLKK